MAYNGSSNSNIQDNIDTDDRRMTVQLQRKLTKINAKEMTIKNE